MGGHASTTVVPQPRLLRRPARIMIPWRHVSLGIDAGGFFSQQHVVLPGIGARPVRVVAKTCGLPPAASRLEATFAALCFVIAAGSFGSAFS
jgi:hypothetical protein